MRGLIFASCVALLVFAAAAHGFAGRGAFAAPLILSDPNANSNTSGAAGAAGSPRAEPDTEYNRGDTRCDIRSTLLTAAALGVAAFAFAAAAVVVVVVEKRTRPGRAPAKKRAGRGRAPPLVPQGVRGLCPLAALLTVFLPSGRRGGGVGMGLAEAGDILSDEQFKTASWGTFIRGGVDGALPLLVVGVGTGVVPPCPPWRSCVRVLSRAGRCNIEMQYSH